MGLTLEGNKLYFKPCLPADWEAFTVSYRYRETVYRITVLQIADGEGEESLTIDGVTQHDLVVALVDDRLQHTAQVRLTACRT